MSESLDDSIWWSNCPTDFRESQIPYIRALSSITESPNISITSRETAREIYEGGNPDDIIFSLVAFHDASRARNIVTKVRRHVRIGIRDEGGNNPDLLRETFEAFEDLCRENNGNGTRILIHCELGQSRSVSFVAALIAKSEKCTFRQALEYIKPHRRINVDPKFAEEFCHAVGVAFK